VGVGMRTGERAAHHLTCIKLGVMQVEIS